MTAATDASAIGGRAAPPLTLGARLGSRDNALNAVRLVLASSVVLGHSWMVLRREDSPFPDLGGWAVYGFFAISGYLIAGSRLRLHFGRYLWNRALRIYPGFWAALLVVAFVAAPASTLITGAHYSLSDGAAYVVSNATLWVDHHGIGATLDDAPFPGVWNSPLWTLVYEMLAYIAFGLFLGMSWVRRRLIMASALAFAGCLAAWLIVLHGFGAPKGFVTNFPMLFTWFAVGVLAYALRDRIVVRWWQGPLLLAICVALWVTGLGLSLGHLPFAALVLWAGAWLPTRIGSHVDLSYGVYIYAFPIQQLLVVSGIAGAVGEWAAAAIALVLVLPVAAASWFGVERPALRLKSRWPLRQRRPTAEVQPSPLTRGDRGA